MVHRRIKAWCIQFGVCSPTRSLKLVLRLTPSECLCVRARACGRYGFQTPDGRLCLGAGRSEEDGGEVYSTDDSYLDPLVCASVSICVHLYVRFGVCSCVCMRESRVES